VKDRLVVTLAKFIWRKTVTRSGGLFYSWDYSAVISCYSISRASLLYVRELTYSVYLEHYIFILFLSSFFFFSSPNLSGRRLDVYHT